MKILVTGGAGFIGSNLSQRLTREGHEVVVIDNFNDYYDVQLKRDRVKTFLDGVTVLEGDITDEDFVKSVFVAHSFDVVCHFAAQAGVRYSIEQPAEYVKANVLGMQILLETMKETGVKQMVYAASSSVYGMDTKAPFKEDEKADRPVSVYAATKRAAELLAYSYHHQYDLDITCLRFFTVYGPWSRPDMAMLKFADLMTAGKPIDVYNNGDLRRDFTYVDDIVDGFTRAVHKPLGYEILNIGNGAPVEVMTFIELLEKELGIEAEKNMLPMQQADVKETYADTTKAKEMIGFESKVDFPEGVQKFAQWYKEYYGV